MVSVERTQMALMTHEEIGALDRDAAVVLIPAGSTEQHGPHLPLDTDTFLCTEVAAAAAATAAVPDGPVLVTPAMAIGSSAHHMAFPGTLTLSSQTFNQAIHEVCASLARHGFKRQIVVNGHGGNRSLLATAVQDIGFEQPVHVVTCNYWELARPVAEKLRESPTGGMAHACEFETSLMMHLRPDSVRAALISREMPRVAHPSVGLDLFAASPVTGHWKTHELSTSGVLGAPDLATEEKGRRFFEACVAGVGTLIEEVRTVRLS
jgi:creatinine amidohydrolase